MAARWSRPNVSAAGVAIAAELPRSQQHETSPTFLTTLSDEDTVPAFPGGGFMLVEFEYLYMRAMHDGLK